MALSKSKSASRTDAKNFAVNARSSLMRMFSIAAFAAIKRQMHAPAPWLHWHCSH